MLAANSRFVLHDDPEVLAMPRDLVRRRLGLPALAVLEQPNGAARRK